MLTPPPAAAWTALATTVAEVDPWLDLCATAVEVTYREGAIRWVLSASTERLTATALAISPIGDRAIGSHVWPIAFAPAPWGSAVVRAVQDHEVSRSWLEAGLAAALPAEAAGWLPPVVWE